MAVIGIQAAMPVEIDRFAEELGAQELSEKGFYKICRARAGKNELILACSGIGKVNAAACAQRLIDRFSVDCIINMGIAGGIAKELKTLDIVIGNEVKYHDFAPESLLRKYYPFTSVFACDERLIRTAQKVCEKTLTSEKYYTGVIASGDCFVEAGETKRRIERELGGKCCEMEGGAIGHVCYLNSVPFLVLRSISDLADENAEMSYSEFEQKAALQANRIVKGIAETVDL